MSNEPYCFKCTWSCSYPSAWGPGFIHDLVEAQRTLIAEFDALDPVDRTPDSWVSYDIMTSCNIQLDNDTIVSWDLWPDLMRKLTRGCTPDVEFAVERAREGDFCYSLEKIFSPFQGTRQFAAQVNTLRATARTRSTDESDESQTITVQLQACNVKPPKQRKPTIFFQTHWEINTIPTWKASFFSRLMLFRKILIEVFENKKPAELSPAMWVSYAFMVNTHIIFDGRNISVKNYPDTSYLLDTTKASENSIRAIEDTLAKNSIPLVDIFTPFRPIFNKFVQEIRENCEREEVFRFWESHCVDHSSHTPFSLHFTFQQCLNSAYLRQKQNNVTEV